MNKCHSVNSYACCERIHVDMGKLGSVHEMIFQVTKYNGIWSDSYFTIPSTEQYQSICSFTPIASSPFGLTSATLHVRIPDDDNRDDNNNKMNNVKYSRLHSSVSSSILYLCDM